MGRTAPTKQIEKYKNSRRKAKRTMNRQRNSWISVKRLYLLLHWPWLCASNWGSSCVREGLNCGSLETELHRTLHHTGPLVEDACISLHSHMWQGSVSSSFSSSLFLVELYSPGYLQNMNYTLCFIPIQLLSFWIGSNLGLFMWHLHVPSIFVWFFSRYFGPTGPDGPVCLVLNWLSSASGVDSSHMLTVRKGLICLWPTCGLRNALQKRSALPKHCANITFLKHVALVKANKNDRRQTSVTNKYAL